MRLHVFNVGVERESPSGAAPGNFRTLRRDLAALPWCICAGGGASASGGGGGGGDCVLAPPPREAFLRALRSALPAGARLPRFVREGEAPAGATRAPYGERGAHLARSGARRARKGGGARQRGCGNSCTPCMPLEAARLPESAARARAPPDDARRRSHRPKERRPAPRGARFCKGLALREMRALTPSSVVGAPPQPLLPSPAPLRCALSWSRVTACARYRQDVVVCRSIAEVEAAIAALAGADAVLKAEYSSSGLGVRVCRAPQRLAQQRPLSGWAANCIARDGRVTVEPWMDIALEVTAEWADGRWLGVSFPIVERRQWVGQWRSLPPDGTSWVVAVAPARRARRGVCACVRVCARVCLCVPSTGYRPAALLLAGRDPLQNCPLSPEGLPDVCLQ